jgi:hypothetical protein
MLMKNMAIHKQQLETGQTGMGDDMIGGDMGGGMEWVVIWVGNPPPLPGGENEFSSPKCITTSYGQGKGFKEKR